MPARQGRSLLSAALLLACAGRCAVTGSDDPTILQAAHVDRFDGASRNVLENGLLLRSDVHLGDVPVIAQAMGPT
ncbi:HNH endonuclease [Isoptericola jiangsuensis]|uniref:HNH endonuclease n=1 Tax=Isoptericola jiangsuensis TaxID=548579 RepID=UPI003AAF3F05